MARRKGFLRRIIDAFRGDQAPKRRATTRETRAFRRDKESSSRQRDAERRERRERQERPYRQTWRDNIQPQRNFAAHYRIFNSLPLGEDITDEEREALWRSYVENMVSGRGFEINDVLQNPFWSDIGIDPGDRRTFPWAEWRRARGYARNR